MLPPEHLKKVVDWCRERGTILVSDECYLECAWDATPMSVLHPSISGGSHEGILAVHSLSKRSNLAGYRCAFVAGDPALVGELLAVRKNLGLIMPGPQQAAMVAALDDDEHVVEQHARYAARRAKLREALETAGFRVDHSEASLYLWSHARRGLLGDRLLARRARHPGRARGRSTAPRARGTSGWRSPPPTSASTPRVARLAPEPASWRARWWRRARRASGSARRRTG